MTMDLNSRCVLVTGASSGIGKACAHAFAEKDCRLLVVARRGERLEELASELTKSHAADVMTAVLDVRDRSAVEAWIDGLA